MQLNKLMYNNLIFPFSGINWRKTSTVLQQVRDQTDEERVTSRPDDERMDWVLFYRELD